MPFFFEVIQAKPNGKMIGDRADSSAHDPKTN
jgi:hypothetical protein